NRAFRDAGLNIREPKQAQAGRPLRRRWQEMGTESGRGSNSEDTSIAEGIINPVVGRIYRALWKTTGAWYAVLLLPTGSFEPVGMTGEIADTDLVTYIPTCFRSNKRAKKILGWSTGFEDGGPLVSKRRFPVMYFAADHYVPSNEGIPEFPEGSTFGWLDAQY